MLDNFDALDGSIVVLRPMVVADITPEYVGWLNDPEVVKYSNQRFVRHTLESCRNYFDGFLRSPNRFVSINSKVDGRLLGTMTAYASPHHQTVDVGIMVGLRSVWGNGIGQDAWNTLLLWLENQRQVRKITAGTMRCNASMVKLIERSGLELEATRPKQELLDGTPQDLLYFGKICAR